MSQTVKVWYDREGDFLDEPKKVAAAGKMNRKALKEIVREVFQEVEALQRTALTPPMITRWSLGAGLPGPALTVAEAVQAFDGHPSPLAQG